MRFLGDQNGEFLTSLGLCESQFDLHAQPARQRFQTRLQRRRMQFTGFSRSLQRHAKLATSDLLFQRLDVRLLFEEKIGNPGNDTGFVPADHGDGGELFYGVPIVTPDKPELKGFCDRATARRMHSRGCDWEDFLQLFAPSDVQLEATWLLIR